MQTIKELEAEIKSLDEQIAPLAYRRSDCKQAILALKSPYKIGDIITWGDHGKKGRIEIIKEWCCGEPMWIVRNILKDGSDGDATDVRNYQKPRLANSEKLTYGWAKGKHEYT